MGFVAALRDECRTVREEETGVAVYGEVQTAPVFGPWIRCRLEDTGTTDQVTDDSARHRYSRRPSIMINKVDKGGQPVDLRPSDQLEVLSPDLGSGMWRLDGGPRVITKRVGLHHYEGTVVRITDDQDDAGD